MIRNARKLLVPLLALMVSCGTEEKESKGREPTPDWSKNPRYKCEERREGLYLAVEKDASYASVLCEKTKLDAAIWGTSIKSAFSLAGKIPELYFRDALIVADPAPAEDYDTEEFRKLNEEILPLPAKDRLPAVINEVVTRFESRCPSLFNTKKPWIPLEIRWRQAMRNEAVGEFRPLYHWSQFDNQAFLKVNSGDRHLIELAVTSTNGDDLSQTWDEKEGTNPRHFRQLNQFNSWVLWPYNKTEYYADATLAHELGHYVIDQILWQDSRLDLQTRYFAEVVASWIASVCFFSHLEEKDYAEKQIAEAFKRGQASEALWPLGEAYFEAIGLAVWTKEPSRNEFYNKGLGLAALLASKHIEEPNPTSTAVLFEATHKAILNMQGRKLTCREEDKEGCAGLAPRINPGLPLERKPHAHTLAEFLVEFEKALGEGGIPKRARNMWDRYKTVLETLEQ